jgi:hypothetical protein
MVYGRENINTLAAVLSANPPADTIKASSRCTAYRKSCCYVSIRSCSIDQVQSAFNVAFRVQR